jgi:hypothetical protein
MLDEQVRFKMFQAHGKYRLKEEIHPGYWAWMTTDHYPFDVVEFRTSPEAEAFVDDLIKSRLEEWIFYEDLDYLGDTRAPNKHNEILEGHSECGQPRDGSEQGNQESASNLAEGAMDEPSGGVREDSTGDK